MKCPNCGKNDELVEAIGFIYCSWCGEEIEE